MRFINEDSYSGWISNPLSLNLYTYVHNNPLVNIDPSGHWCEAVVNGKIYAHSGGCNDGISGKERFSGPGYTPDEWHNEDKIYFDGEATGVYFVGFGSVIYGKEYSLGTKGWSFRMDKGDVRTKTQDHIHVYGEKGKQWSQNADGSPHDKNKNSGGTPPNSVKKKLKKKIDWDWDAKAKSYIEESNLKEHTLYMDEGGDYFVVSDGAIRYLSESEVNLFIGVPNGQPIPEGGTSPRFRVVPRFVVP